MAPKKNNNDILIKLDTKLDSVKDQLDYHMGDLNSKMERFDSRLDNVDVTLGKQQLVLDEHVKRTNMLEDKIKPFEVRETQLKLLLKIGAGMLAAGAGGFGIKELLVLIFG